jgi:malonate decarboxylase alpha subunit
MTTADFPVAPASHEWDRRRVEKRRRMEAVAPMLSGRRLDASDVPEALSRLLTPGDIVVLEGDNQKHATHLADALLRVDQRRVRDLHLVVPCLGPAQHLDVFDRGIASALDFCYAGSQSSRLAAMLSAADRPLVEFNTYLELYARLTLDLVPAVTLVAADEADVDGNLYTGANTEETPTLVEATAFRDGIVVAQVNRFVDRVTRVDIPGDWVDIVVPTDTAYRTEALFTRDPARITDQHVLLAMLTIRGVYERHGITSLNHGIGYNTAAIELLLPTYGEKLGLRGRICRHWALNPHPTLIPAIESGWVERVMTFGGEVGMHRYVEARPDVFPTSARGGLRSNRLLAQLAGLYAVDAFVGSTLQIDRDANSSTVTRDRITGFGGAPNLGHDPRGRRHVTAAWLDLTSGVDPGHRGRKIVTQVVSTRALSGQPTFVDALDAVAVADAAAFETVPVMIYGSDVTHLVTEHGVAYLYMARDGDERRQLVAAVAGDTSVGADLTDEVRDRLRQTGAVATATDLQIDVSTANRAQLAAQSIQELVDWSGGLFEPTHSRVQS